MVYTESLNNSFTKYLDMAWSTGNFYIAPGATIRINFWWPRPGDRGLQWAMAHPLRGEGSSILWTERGGKRVQCEIGRLVINGPATYSCGDASTAYWDYFVDIKNDGSSGMRFTLTGGGVT